MKKLLILFAALIAVAGFVFAEPVPSGENPAFPNYFSFDGYEVFCHNPQNNNVTLCKIYEEVKVSEGVFELQFVANAHIWINPNKPPKGPDDWVPAPAPFDSFLVRFTPRGRISFP